MKLDTFRRLDDHARRIRQLERTEAESGGGGDHADSDHADAFSALAHTHGPGGGSVAWADITGKPSTFPPDEHDPSHDDRFALVVHSHAAHADSDHDDRFSLLAHVHVVAWADITGKPSTFAPTEHDSDHSDVFSPLAHTHAAHADSDHDDRFSLLAHVHDWASITGKPATFAPTPQALDWLTDVITGTPASGHVLTYNGSNWGSQAAVSADWASITGKPSTFPPTPEMLTLGQLSDVNTAGASDGTVLTYDSTAPAGWKAEPSTGLPAGGTAGQQLVKASTSDYDADWETVGGGAVGIPPGGLDRQVLTKTSSTDYAVDWELPAPEWAEITLKPSTFPPDEHDSAHDDRFSLLAHTHTAPTWTQVTGKPTVFTPDEHDTAHDDRFSLLAHTHAAHADSDHDDRFALIDHDTAHDDRFSLLAHTHTGPVELGYAQITSNVTVTATTSATSQLVVALGAITYTAVPHEFEWYSPYVNTAATAGAMTHVGLYDGSAATPLGRATVRNPAASASNGWPVYGYLRMTPSAGSHTYQIRTYTTNTGGSVNAGAGGSDVTVPAWIKVTRL